MECLLNAGAWITDDAVNVGNKLDPQRFKVIVTGEPTNVPRKYKSDVRISFAIPVVLTLNALPDVRDDSNAVFDRSLVLKLTREFSTEEARAKKLALGLTKDTWIADYLFDQEGPGILNWALTGLDRLLKRGYYDVPAPVVEATRNFREQSNSVAE